jgi:hypothetical protein
MNAQPKLPSRTTVFAAIGLLASALFAAPAIAARIGYYDLETGQGEEYQVAPIVAAGHTPVQMFSLSDAELAGIDVLFALNPSNVDPYGPEYVQQLAAVTTAVNNGMVLCFADRRVTEAAARIPGGSGISFTRDQVGPGNLDINIADNTTSLTNGPGGAVTNTNLDGGNVSNHGFATVSTLPGGSRVILVRTPSEAVTFSYPVGRGAVVYTTIPVDWYLQDFGSPPEVGDAFKNIYAPNMVEYCASVAERSTLGPISLRYCHSAAHTGDPSCTREIAPGVVVATTGQVASQDAPQTTCAPGEPTTGTANVSVTPRDHVTVSWNDLNCGANDGLRSVRVNAVNRDSVGVDVKLVADSRANADVRLRVLPRDGEYDDYCEEDERPKRPQRIVVETLYDRSKLERWAINGDERIDVRIANSVPDEVITSAAVKFWVGRRIFGPKTIIAKAFRNGEPVGEPVRREFLAVPRTSFADVTVYTPANFGGDFDRIEFRAAHGSWFGLGSADLKTTRPPIP